MKFIRDLLSKKRGKKASEELKEVDTLEQSYRDTVGAMDQTESADDALDPSVTEMLSDIRKKTDAPAVNIWDMEGDTSSELPQVAPTLPTAAPAAPALSPRSPGRSRRTKTRLIGFEKSDGDVVDLFDDTPKPAAAPAKRAKFPVGWIVVADGPGRGESFPLFAGMSPIGRGEDQAVQLDFGDNAISRSNHAAIVYDPDTKEYLLGHGGKSNIVRLNSKPVISNEPLKSGDMIRIGETKLRFVALCSEEFNWGTGADGEDEDVAIA